MTFLEIVQLFYDESGSSGTRPGSVSNQSGERLRLVNWVKNADYEIKAMWHNWKFLSDTTTFSETLAAAQQIVTKPSTLNIWDEATFRLDGQLIDVVEYEEIKSEVLDITSRNQPSRLIILPNNNIQLDQIPGQSYVLSGSFYKKPVKMSANGSVSEIPEEFHETVILGKALMYYGRRENAGEIYDKGEELFDDNIGVLESLQLPNKFNSRYRSTSLNIQVIAE